MNAKDIKGFLVGAIVVASSISVLAVTIPNSFSAGTPIKASDVNANFGAINTALENHDHYGQTWEGDGGTGLAVRTKTGSIALFGQNNSTVANAYAVAGLAKSTTGAGVFGNNPNGFGVQGASSSGTGGRFESTSGTAGRFVSTSGVAGSFESGGVNVAMSVSQNGSGDIIRGYGPGSTLPKFYVLGNGDVISVGTFTGQGFNNASDRNVKKNFSSVDARNVLEKVAAMPITRWTYRTDASSVAHVGPMAQDFHAAFGLNGSDDKHISSIDAQGVTLAAIQGLNQKLEAENAKLRSSLTDLEKRLAALERK